MKINEAQQILEAEVIVGADMLDAEAEVGCAADLMSDMLAFGKPDSLLLTGLTNPQVVHTAEVCDIKAICFVRGKKPEARTVKLASEAKIILMTTHLPMYESCGRLYKHGLPGIGYLDITKNGRK